VSLIVSGVAFSLYRLNASYYVNSEASLNRQRNLRVALYTLTRELRMAGSGLFVLGSGLNVIQAYAPDMLGRDCNQKPVIPDALTWLKACDAPSGENGVRAIFGEDGGATSSDMVTIFRADPEFSEVLGEATSFSDWKLNLMAATTAESFKAGDILGLVNGDQAVLLEVATDPSASSTTEIRIKSDGRYTGSSGPPLGFPVNGSNVFNLRDVTIATYYVDENTSQLMVVYHDQKINPDSPVASPPIPIADGIEDLQLYYFFDGEDVDNTKINLDPGIDTAKLKVRKVMAVSVGLTAKTLNDRSAIPQIRPALFNRAAGTTVENSSRLSILETVQLRNAQ
jgi:hypothetical protein